MIYRQSESPASACDGAHALGKRAVRLGLRGLERDGAVSDIRLDEPHAQTEPL